MAKLLEQLGVSTSWVGVSSGNHQGRAKCVTQIDGDSDFVLVCAVRKEVVL